MPLFLSGSQMVFWPHQGWGLEVVHITHSACSALVWKGLSFLSGFSCSWLFFQPWKAEGRAL